MTDRDSEEARNRDYFNKGFTDDEILEKALERVRFEKKKSVVSVLNKIRSLLDGPCMGGYRHIWHTLKMQGICFPCLENWIPKERRKEEHCDGYDKLKPFGFPIHACIDGWSRKVLWLYVMQSNNWPHNIATYCLDAV